METENWKAIAGYEGRYEVSDHGNVKSLLTNRILCPAPNSRGYMTVQLYLPGKPKSFLVHAIVAEAFFGPRPEGRQVNHIDGDKRNNAASNLEYVTQSINMRHADAHGLIERRRRGESHPNSKLTDAEVRAIRAMAAARGNGRRPRELSNAAIGRIFGVSECTIASVIVGELYASVA